MNFAISQSKCGGQYMYKRIGSAFFALAVVFGISFLTSSTAQAQYDRNRTWERNRSDRDWRRNRDNDDWRRRRDNGRYRNRGSNNAYQYDVQRGYQQGLNTGASDAQRGQSYSPQRSRYYQKAPSVPFRDGFVRGYDQGYRQYAYNNGRYGNGRYGNGRYGNGRYGNDGYYGNQQELNRGYQQGLETGSSDARRGQSYDPQRSRHWRNASTQEFRAGFERGYDEGYRRYGYNNGNYRTGGIGIGDILGGILGRP